MADLLDAGADGNAQGGEYSSALQAASDRGHLNIITKLIDAGAGADVNSLQAASKREHVLVVRMLKEAGANDLDGNCSNAGRIGCSGWNIKPVASEVSVAVHIPELHGLIG